jgi:hypothetical protein
VRVDEHSKPFEPKLATLDEILRLTERRKALVDHRNQIRRTAMKRWKALGTPCLSNSKRPAPAILFWALPEFPAQRVIEPRGLHALLQQAAVQHSRSPWHECHWDAQQDAIVVRSSAGRDPSHLELTSWGSVFVAEHLCGKTDSRLGPVCYADVKREQLIAYPALWLLFLRNLLSRVGFQAQVLVRVELHHVRGIPVEHLGATWGPSETTDKAEYARSVVDDKVRWEENLSAADLISNLPQYAVRAYRRLAFGVGCRDAYEKPGDKEIIAWGRDWLGLNNQDLLPA